MPQTFIPDDYRIADLLNDYASGVAPLDVLLAHYGVTAERVRDLAVLADQLREVLVTVSPAASFVDDLYRELVGHKRAARTLWGRVQNMPPRVKLAAGIGGLTLTAGVLLITVRSLSHILETLANRAEAAGESAA
jgi:hypothetical protein